MFSSKDKGSNTHYDTLISVKTEITGDVKFTGGLHIDGVIKGNLVAEAGSGAVVRVSDKGRVEGQISAPNIIINGKVIGDVHAGEYIELAKKAQVTGDVYYQMMEMVMGAEVNGKLHHQAKGDNRKKPEPVAVVATPEVKVD
ncbi:MAG: polymer-forming cytoskeletal protein [Saccharospirillaceae bacterium]|jgi:cytoskeletal protein CcmA (bactofilin family)|uniref:bactofilin family protein n=1 Tax=Venatorbacter sp. C2-1 TaxID=2597518 RepID=UPI001192C45C|nr:polymer-forming cytoskeletal protein [Thalassolituus sp. C2-1]MCD8521859.1 polymer-forming cytoskeletal protein [Saccharospirillaceae bacterium]MCD8531639.1 polymer-forming cytoskeletal protein [Saccharospirillaceae bacterium]TVV44373.1 polymer-forming cytoskeletal protein [Thalassolituus sp. C2-1]